MPDQPFYPKVLIADDHFAARQLVANVMREHKINNVHMAADGKEAQEAIYAAVELGQPFDIVFLDWDMPTIAGIDVLKHFRMQPQFNQMAFVMLTAASQQSEVLQAVKAGTTAYIAKPVSPAGIGKKFVEVISWVKKQRAGGDKAPPAS